MPEFDGLGRVFGPGLPTETPFICVFQDGNQWCAVFPDFINLEESESAFGTTVNEAVNSLLRLVADESDRDIIFPDGMRIHADDSIDYGDGSRIAPSTVPGTWLAWWADGTPLLSTTTRPATSRPALRQSNP